MRRFSLVLEKNSEAAQKSRIRSTTVICVRRNGEVVMAADGQVTLGEHVLKHSAKKIRRLYQERILAGFAGRRPMRSACLRALRPSWSIPFRCPVVPDRYKPVQAPHRTCRQILLFWGKTSYAYMRDCLRAETDSIA